MTTDLVSAIPIGVLPSTNWLTADGQLKIEACELVAKGRSRAVYAHPSAPGLIVKVMLSDYVETEILRPKRIGKWIVGRWRKFGPYGIFFREMRETIRATRAMHPNYGFTFPFARFYGFIWTTLGLGQVVERIGSADGSLAPTLRQLLKEGRFTAEHAARLDDFFDICMEKGFVVGAVHAHNIVYQDSMQRFVCIDGFGDKNTIPIHEVSRFANRLKLKRARRRLARTVRELSTGA